MKTATDAQRRRVIEKHLVALEKQKAAQTAQINRLNSQLSATSLQSSASRWATFASPEELRCACDVLLEEVLRRERARESTEEDMQRARSEIRELLQQRGRARAP